MSTQVQRRKGTTVQHSTFTGASAELTVDTTKNTVVVHDGATAGGIPLAKETGSAISATSLSLPNSTTNGVAYVNGSKVVVAGSVLTFDGDSLSVNGITVGKGGGAQATNTSVGALALGINVDGQQNTVVGYNAMKGLTSANRNTAVGAVALWTDSTGWDNTAIGWGALFPSTGTGNTALGMNAGGSMSSGSKNTIIGSFSGNGGGLDIRTLNNYIVLSDGDANPRAWWNGANPTFPGAITLFDGTANGVTYLNGSKVLTSGTALTFDGTTFTLPRLGQSSSGNYGYFNTTGSGNGFLSFQYNGSEIGEIGQGSGIISGGSNTDFGIRATNNLVFGISYNEQMRLTSTGLGIGTSSPNTKLDIAGTSASVEATLRNNNGRMVLTQQAAGGTFTQYYKDSAASYVGGVGTAVPGGSAQSALIFSDYQGSWVERMRLDASGNLGLGTTSPSASAILDAQSTTKGVRMPNMTTTQKNAIASPAAGLMVFDTTLAKLCVYTGAAWQTITSI